MRITRTGPPRLAGLALAVAVGLGLSVVIAGPALALPTRDAGGYVVHNLVSDQAGHATHTDTNLVNAWGIAASGSSPWWVANNGTGTSTLYDGTGAPFPIASPRVVAVPGDPTGMVFNGTGQFPVTNSSVSGTSTFIWASEDGTISGWNINVPAAGSNHAFVIATSPDGAVYKGLAIGSSGGANYLYATDFHNGKVDVLDGTNAFVHWAGAFTDPALPQGYAPFGIQNLGGTVFVTYAKQAATGDDEVAGHALGVVDAYGTDGSFMGRVAQHGRLDAPWGLAMAPAGFGRVSGDLLVGNFGDGRINAFHWDGDHWRPAGQLEAANHRALVIDGLWGIGFGNGANSGPLTTLYFAAGPDDESHGLFGSITVAP